MDIKNWYENGYYLKYNGKYIKAVNGLGEIIELSDERPKTNHESYEGAEKFIEVFEMNRDEIEIVR